MKYRLFICILTLAANNAIACLSASQHRIFPMGLSSEGLCVVETHLYRMEFREEGEEVIELKPAWGGVSYLKIYDSQQKEIHSEVLDSIKLFKQVHYNAIIEKTFNKGLKLARQYSGFVEATPNNLSFCDYQKSCSKAELLVDTPQNDISIRLPSQSQYSIRALFDSTSIASNLLNYYQGFSDEKLSAASFEASLYINSIRELTIRDKKLIVVHIGTGQTFTQVKGGTYPPGKEYKANFDYNNMAHSVFEEPVLHHGHGFDFYIWE